MSNIERNKGYMTKVQNVKIPDTDKSSLLEWMEENDYIIFNGELYKINFEIKKSEGDWNFALAHKNEDKIEFHTMHHNGGASFHEMLEIALKDIKK